MCIFKLKFVNSPSRIRPPATIEIFVLVVFQRKKQIFVHFLELRAAVSREAKQVDI
jgi:hypothetical protein